MYLLLVEDDPMVCQLLEVFLSHAKKNDIILSSDSTSLSEVCCKSPSIDMVILDICNERNVACIEEVQYIKSLFPSVKTLLITDRPEFSFRERARNAGVDSFWYKTPNLDELLSIIEETMRGQSVYPDHCPVFPLGNASTNDFSLRELEVLREVVAGEMDVVIAEKLHLSPRTVKGHIQSMREKTGFRNRTELAVRARESGLVINATAVKKNID